jgi:hypothetical protein
MSRLVYHRGYVKSLSEFNFGKDGTAAGVEIILSEHTVQKVVNKENNNSEKYFQKPIFSVRCSGALQATR